MRKLAFVSAVVFLLTAASVMAGESVRKDDFDRLDGRGPSRVKVDVIEWEGNLEVHVYPGGSLKSLAAKLDERERDKKVMVLGFRLHGQPGRQLVRRAILGVPFRAGFVAFRDASVTDYDKVILSNHKLADLKPIELEPGPAQLYPEGHPANEVASADGAADAAGSRLPASQVRAPFVPPRREADPAAAVAEPPRPARAFVDENGAIRPFEFR